ncbi:glycosyltransferase family 2 protein [Luteimonas sp. FXH3W]|uniref:Glycosyltransferase family 2 protein n=1 Tax=Aquilutibacter rugosus TaxID=3115820 RepID=A0ABU7V151_9GAMM
MSNFSTTHADAAHRRLTVLVAAYNEASSLPLLHPLIRAALDDVHAAHGIETRVLYVDDGSHDATWSILQSFREQDPQVSVLRLSRNFGKEIALTAGLDQIEQGGVVILDADGQDPPALISSLVPYWLQGYDDVYGTRTNRDGELWFKRITAKWFYRVIGHLSDTPIPADTGDFRLLSERAVQALGQLRERNRFMKGLFGWVGYNRISVPYSRAPRNAGKTKFNFRGLWNLALDGITSFSLAPLRLATYTGVVAALFAFAGMAFVMIRAALYGDPVAGWPSMMAVILFIGGVQLLALGVIGEYLGRMYNESKQRPLYLVDQQLPDRSGH